MDCMILTYYDDSTGPDDLAGFICQLCADDLVGSGHATAGPAPRWVTKNQ